MKTRTDREPQSLHPRIGEAALLAFGLQRTLRTRDATALIVSNVIGVGIFTTPGIVAGMVPNPLAMLSVWLFGGLLTFAGATAYSELSKLCPRSGGEYSYLRQAFGALAGFLSGWISLIAGFSGAIAASAVAFATYLGRYLPAAASEQALISIPLAFTNVSLSARSLTAASIILFFGAIHIFGLGFGRLAQNALAVLILVIIIGFTLAGFALGNGSMAHLRPVSAPFSGMKWLLALIPVMFTYSGWNAAAYVCEEAVERERTVGRALAIGTSVVIAIYLALNLLFVFALPIGRLGSAINVGDSAAQALFGTAGEFTTLAVIIALAGAISSMSLAGPRVYFTMARDGAFLQAFGRVHPRFRTPAFAIALQTMWSIVLVIAGKFEQILMYTGFAVVLSSGASVFALFILDRRSGSAALCLRTKILAGSFVIASLVIVMNMIAQAPRMSVIGLLLMAAGIPVFSWSKKRQSDRDFPPRSSTARI